MNLKLKDMKIAIKLIKKKKKEKKKMSNSNH